MADIEQLKDFDFFYYYDSNPVNLNDEISSDIYQLLLQPKRSLFYSRSQNSAGINDYENFPNSVSLRITMPYDIIIAISKRNTNVSNGQGQTIDRRIAASQNTVKIEQFNEDVTISIFYVQLSDIQQQQRISFPLGGINR